MDAFQDGSLELGLVLLVLITALHAPLVHHAIIVFRDSIQMVVLPVIRAQFRFVPTVSQAVAFAENVFLHMSTMLLLKIALGYPLKPLLGFLIPVMED